MTSPVLSKEARVDWRGGRCTLGQWVRGRPAGRADVRAAGRMGVYFALGHSSRRHLRRPGAGRRASPRPPPRPCRVGALAAAAARRAGRDHVVSGESTPQPAGRGAARGAAPSVCPRDGSWRGGQVNPAPLAGCGRGRPFLGSTRRGAGRPRAVLPGRGSAPPEGGGRSGPGVPHRSLPPSRGRRTKAGQPGFSGERFCIVVL